MVQVMDSSRLLLLSAPKVRIPYFHVHLKEPLGMLDEMERPLETVR
jgi:hypothetical protein